MASAAACLGVFWVAQASHAQEIRIRGPLTCAAATVCAPARRAGLLALTGGLLLPLSDHSSTTLLAAGTLRYFTSERFGFGAFAAHAAATRTATPTRPDLGWVGAPEVLMVLAVGRLSVDVPVDWLVSAGPMLGQSPDGTGVRLSPTFGSAITLFAMPYGVSFALDGRLLRDSPGHAFAGLSIGIGTRIARGCRDFASESGCRSGAR